MKSWSWSREFIYEDSDEFFKDILVAIDSAQRSVEIEVYIFERGRLADRITQALIAAKARGLRVRVMADGFGSPDFYEHYMPTLEAHGVKVKSYKSWPWARRRFRGEARRWLPRLYNRFLSFNRRNHRKMYIIDGQSAWVGSQNISDKHLKEVYPEEHWQDTGALVEGAEVLVLEGAFQRTFSGKKNLPSPRSQLIVLNDGIRQRLRANGRLINLMKGAKDRIWIQTPYFVPPRKLVRALIKAAQRGVDVRIIVPQKNDVQIVRWMSLVVLQTLIKKGVEVFEFKPRFSHQKILQVDAEAFVGSTNFNHRSFIHDLEVQVALTDPTNKEILAYKFEREMRESEKLSEDNLAFRGWFKQSFYRLLFMLRYWS